MGQFISRGRHEEPEASGPYWSIEPQTLTSDTPVITSDPTEADLYKPPDHEILTNVTKTRPPPPRNRRGRGRGQVSTEAPPEKPPRKSLGKLKTSDDTSISRLPSPESQAQVSSVPKNFLEALNRKLDGGPPESCSLRELDTDTPDAVHQRLTGGQKESVQEVQKVQDDSSQVGQKVRGPGPGPKVFLKPKKSLKKLSKLASHFSLSMESRGSVTSPAEGGVTPHPREDNVEEEENPESSIDDEKHSRKNDFLSELNLKLKSPKSVDEEPVEQEEKNPPTPKVFLKPRRSLKMLSKLATNISRSLSKESRGSVPSTAGENEEPKFDFEDKTEIADEEIPEDVIEGDNDTQSPETNMTSELILKSKNFKSIDEGPSMENEGKTTRGPKVFLKPRKSLKKLSKFAATLTRSLSKENPTLDSKNDFEVDHETDGEEIQEVETEREKMPDVKIEEKNPLQMKLLTELNLKLKIDSKPKLHSDSVELDRDTSSKEEEKEEIVEAETEREEMKVPEVKIEAEIPQQMNLTELNSKFKKSISLDPQILKPLGSKPKFHSVSVDMGRDPSCKEDLRMETVETSSPSSSPVTSQPSPGPSNTSFLRPKSTKRTATSIKLDEAFSRLEEELEIEIQLSSIEED